MSFPELFEFVELLEITRPPDPHLSHSQTETDETPDEEDTPPSDPSDSSKSLLEGVRQDIMRVCLKDYGEMSVLVLYCRNGHLFYRLSHRQRPTKFRIVRWFQGCWICDMCLSPDSHWLLVACSHGMLKIVSVLPILFDDYLSDDVLETRDIDTVVNLRSYGCPACVAWWSAQNGRNFGIIGFQKGTIAFVDLNNKEIQKVIELGSEYTLRELLLERKHRNSSTSLFIATTCNVNFCCLLETTEEQGLIGTLINGASSKSRECSSEEQIDYLSRQESISNILQKSSSDAEFSPQRILMPKDSYKLYPYRLNRKSYIALLDSSTNKLLLCQDIDLLSQPLLEYALPKRTYDFLLANNILYTLSSRGDNMYLSVLSAHKCSLLARREQQDISSALIYQIMLPSHERVRKIFPLLAQPQILTKEYETTTFIQCLVVTRYKVYQCRQLLAPETLFLQLASRETTIRKADRLGITLQLDICVLYERSSEYHLEQGNYSLALDFYKLAKTSPNKIASSLSKYNQFDLLVNYLRQELSMSDCLDVETKSNILFKLLIGKLLREPLPESKLILELDVRIFLHTNQHYDESEILKMLLESNLESLAIDMTLVNGIVQELICLCAKKGRFILHPSTVNKILLTRFADLLATLCHGAFLQHMQLFSIFHLMLKYPETSHPILSAIRDRMHLFSVSDLLMLSVMFDPSQDFIKHLVQQSQRSRFVPGRGLQHSASMDSLNQFTLGWTVSTVSDSTYSHIHTRLEFDLADGSESQREVRPQNYFEMFIESLLWLNQKRSQDTTPSFLHNELFIQNTSKLLSNFLKLNETDTHSGIQVSCGSSHAGYLLHNQVFMWTTSVEHVLSPSSFIAEDMHPLTVPLLSFLHIKVLEISCGMEHSLVRTSYGVYAWGDNRCGQLGVGDRNKRQLPTVIDSLSSSQIIAIACGETHSLVIDIVNRVHVFGDNRYGQLGIGTKDPYQTIPLILPLSVSIVQACGGSMHSVLLSADGAVYAMGSNYYGQLGVEGMEESSEPVRVEILTEHRVLVIASGAHTCVACGRNTQLWLWGQTIGKQEIGSEVEQIEQSKSALITLDIDLKVGDQLKDVAVGISHCLLLTKNGFILSWGSNEYGQCGVGTYSQQQEPEILPINLTGVRFISISAHMNISAAIDSQNRCFVWGNIFPYSTTPSSSLASETTLCVSPSVCSNLPSLIHHIQSDWDISILSEAHNATDDSNGRISDFPDFSCLGSLSYGSEALESALKELYSLYSSSRISRLCHSMNNLQATAVLMEMRGDIPRALEFRFRHLVQTTTQQELLPRLTELLYIHLDSLLSQNQGAHTTRASFLNQGILLVRSAHGIFLTHSLPLETLEEVFASRIEGLAYPLYLFIKEIIENGDSPPFSLSLCTQITLITAQKIAGGHPDPLLVLSSNEHTSITRPVNEDTIWGHVIHNLTKDLDSSESFQIDYNRVKSFYTSAADDEMVLFSCGHFYSGLEFNKTVLPKFENLLSQNLPSFGKQTTQRILQHYWSEDKFNIGCPACVFINLQQIATNN